MNSLCNRRCECVRARALMSMVFVFSFHFHGHWTTFLFGTYYYYLCAFVICTIVCECGMCWRGSHNMLHSFPLHFLYITQLGNRNLNDLNKIVTQNIRKVYKTLMKPTRLMWNCAQQKNRLFSNVLKETTIMQMMTSAHMQKILFFFCNKYFYGV